MSVETFPVAPPQSSSSEPKPREVKQEAKALRVISPEVRERQQRADDIVRRHSLWALGTGAILVPALDSAAAAAVQLKMLKSLSDLYGVKFSEDLGKKVLGSVVMSVGAVVAGTAAASLLKAIPGVGMALGAVSSALSAAAFTTALGRVFILHFETGGTLLNLDARQLREHFWRELKKEKPDSTPPME